MRRAAVVLASLAAFTLTACGPEREKPVASVKGECRVYKRAAYAYAGKSRHDQQWIDEQIESGVAGCRFKRPDPRPAAWDGPTYTVNGKTVPLLTPPAR